MKKGEFIFDNVAMAQKTVKDCVCAACYGPVVMQFAPWQKYQVTCPKCGEDRGFVTRDWAEKRKAESHAELVEAKSNLAEAMGLNEPKKSTEKIKQELGY